MAHSTPIFILSLLLLATISNACNTCMLPSPPRPNPTPPPAACPKDTLKLGSCMDLLGGVIVGSPMSNPCCPLLQGMADMEVVLCLCIVIKANMLGMPFNIPIAMSSIIGACGKSVPPGYKCE